MKWKKWTKRKEENLLRTRAKEGQTQKERDEQPDEFFELKREEEIDEIGSRTKSPFHIYRHDLQVGQKERQMSASKGEASGPNGHVSINMREKKDSRDVTKGRSVLTGCAGNKKTK